MAKRETVDNSQLLDEILKLRKEMNTKFKEIEPYIEFLRDANVARKIAAYMFGVFIALGGAYLMLKQLFPNLPPHAN